MSCHVDKMSSKVKSHMHSRAEQQTRLTSEIGTEVLLARILRAIRRYKNSAMERNICRWSFDGLHLVWGILGSLADHSKIFFSGWNWTATKGYSFASRVERYFSPCMSQFTERGFQNFSIPYLVDKINEINKLASLEATLVRNSAHRLTYLLTDGGEV